MDDLISRQAAIDNLERYRELFSWDDGDRERAILSRVIKELQSMPTADLSEYCDKLWKTAYERGKRDARVIKLTEADKERLRKAMENAELTLVAEPKKGKWLPLADGWACCSECEHLERAAGLKWRFCPNCGARMEESDG